MMFLVELFPSRWSRIWDVMDKQWVIQRCVKKTGKDWHSKMLKLWKKRKYWDYAKQDDEE